MTFGTFNTCLTLYSFNSGTFSIWCALFRDQINSSRLFVCVAFWTMTTSTPNDNKLEICLPLSGSTYQIWFFLFEIVMFLFISTCIRLIWTRYFEVRFCTVKMPISVEVRYSKRIIEPIALRVLFSPFRIDIAALRFGNGDYWISKGMGGGCDDGEGFRSINDVIDTNRKTKQQQNQHWNCQWFKWVELEGLYPEWRSFWNKCEIGDWLWTEHVFILTALVRLSHAFLLECQNSSPKLFPTSFLFAEERKKWMNAG